MQLNRLYVGNTDKKKRMNKIFTPLLTVFIIAVIAFGVSSVDSDNAMVKAGTAYETGVEYDANSERFITYKSDTYQNHPTTQLDNFTTWLSGKDINGQVLDANTALCSEYDTAEGNLMVLNFVDPVLTSEFNTLNLRIMSTFNTSLTTYNRNNVTDGSLGIIMQQFSVRDWHYIYLELNTDLYKDSDGFVRTVVFRIEQGGINENSQFFFVSFNLENKEREFMTEDSFIISEKENGYGIEFQFNGNGAQSRELDTEHILLNGYTLKDVLIACNDATARWIITPCFYRIGIDIPKAYDGIGKIVNPNLSFAGNSITVLSGLELPDGSTLEKTYSCHIYANENILDTEYIDNYGEINVNNVTYMIDKNSTDNIRFTVYFDKNVISSPYYHASAVESWRSSELVKFTGLYNSGKTKIYINGGFKSSLLDSVVINGRSIAEWHAREKNRPSVVQVHYGNTGLNCLDILIESGSIAYAELLEFVQQGNGIDIQIKDGLKFNVNRKLTETVNYVLTDGKFCKVVEEDGIRVYFDGTEINNGDEITCKAEVSKSSIAVKGIGNYTVEESKNGNETLYTVKYGGDKRFGFTVTEKITEVQSAESTGSAETSTGCGSGIYGSAYSVFLTIIIFGGIILSRRKRQ